MAVKGWSCAPLGVALVALMICAHIRLSAARVVARELASTTKPATLARSGPTFTNLTQRVFTVVIDCGSSGSRVNVYEFLTNSHATRSRPALHGKQIFGQAGEPNRYACTAQVLHYTWKGLYRSCSLSDQQGHVCCSPSLLLSVCRDNPQSSPALQAQASPCS